MTTNVTRSLSLDLSAFRPDFTNKNQSEFVSGLKRVNSAPHLQVLQTDGLKHPQSDGLKDLQTDGLKHPQSDGLKDPQTDGLKDKSQQFELLKFRNDYRNAIAVNIMSQRSEAFKTAFNNKDSDGLHKRELENTAIAIYLAEKALCANGKDTSEFKVHVSNWFKAIEKANKKNSSNFAAKQNFGIGHSNSVRIDYRKATDNLGSFLQKEFEEPKNIAKIVMDDVTKKCGDVLARHNIDIADAPSYLHQTAILAEQNLRNVVDEFSSSQENLGSLFLEKLALHINSRLNYPNYLREILTKPKDKTDQPTSEPPVQPGIKNFPPAQPLNIPNTGLQSPTAPAPVVVNLSNIGNPTVTVDLGDKFDSMVDKLEKLLAHGNPINHVHHHVCDCRHVSGSSMVPHNFTALEKTLVDRDGHNADISESDFSTTNNIPLVANESLVNYLSGGTEHSEYLQDSTNSLDSHSNDISGDEVAGDPTNIGSNHGTSTSHVSLESSVTDVTNSSDSDNQQPDGDVRLNHVHVDESDHSNDSSLLNDNETVDVADKALSYDTRTMPHIETFLSKQERVDLGNALNLQGLLRPDNDETGDTLDQAEPYLTRPIPHNDTFIAKQERAGNGVTLSLHGLLRPNLVGNNTSFFTRQSTAATATPVRQSALDTRDQNDVSFSEELAVKTSTSAASIMFPQRSKSLEFESSDKFRQPRRSMSHNDEISDSEKINRADSVNQKSIISTLSEELLSDISRPGRVGDIVSALNINTYHLSDDRNNNNGEEMSTMPASGKESIADGHSQLTLADVRKRPYSPYLDEQGNRKSPVTLTVDGLHRSLN